MNSRPLPYQGSALPLSYTGVVWSGRRGSNPRPSAWKADALPTELLPRIIPALPITQPAEIFDILWARMDSNHRRHRQQIYSLPHLATLVLALFIEPMKGVEPPTPRLQITCSGQLSYIGKSMSKTSCWKWIAKIGINLITPKLFGEFSQMSGCILPSGQIGWPVSRIRLLLLSGESLCRRLRGTGSRKFPNKVLP